MATKKAATKKVASKKTAPKKGKAKSNRKKAKPKEIMLQSAGEETSGSADCMCMQKKPNGKFYPFRLQQGRWVQSSGISFPTKEICEDASC